MYEFECGKIYLTGNMAKKKLIRFAALPELQNVRQEPGDLRGYWAQAFFKNDHPITLELACGKGEYTVALAQRFPQRNFIGIDIKGARIWVGATQALALGLGNAAFVRTAIEDLQEYFAEGEIREIWITFPDPHPTFGKRRKRLTSPRFLDIYRTILQAGGLIHLKTDDENLYNYTLQTLRDEGSTVHTALADIEAVDHDFELLNIQTKYEKQHLQAGKRIKYIEFSL